MDSKNTDKKPPITILCDTLPPEFSGAGTRIMTQGRQMIAKGATITYITQTPGAKEAAQQQGHLLPGLEIISIPKRHPKQEWKKLLATPRVVFDIIKQLPPTGKVVLCVSGGTNMYTLAGILASLIKKKKVIVGTTLVGADDPMTVKQSTLGRLRFAILKKAKAYVSISPQLHALHLKAGLPADKCFMIPNSVDLNRFKPITQEEKIQLRRSMGYDEDATILLTVGAISPRKGTLDIVKAAIALIQTNLDPKHRIMCLCVGPEQTIDQDESYTQQIKEAIKEAGAQEQILFLGERSDVDKLMQISDCFLFNSSHEGFGNVLIEAQATGIGVVSRRLEGVTDYIINDKIDGFLYNEPEALYKTLKEALSQLQDEATRLELRAAALRNAKERFSHEVVIKAYLDLFDNLAGGQQ